MKVSEDRSFAGREQRAGWRRIAFPLPLDGGPTQASAARPVTARTCERPNIGNDYALTFRAYPTETLLTMTKPARSTQRTPGPILALTLPLTLALALSSTAAIAGPAFTYSHSSATGFQSEIVAFDSQSKTLWVAGFSGVDVLDARTGALVQRIDTRAYGAINSVAVHNGIAAMAFESTRRSDPGVVKLFDTATRSLLAGTNSFVVGSLPDMLVFTPDGKKLLVANEGTPNFISGVGGINDYGTRIGTTVPRAYGYADTTQQAQRDPAGSVSFIDMATRTVSATASLLGVTRTGSHIRSNTGMDFEPEYIAINAAGTKAYVSLQEANAMGVLDIQSATFEKIIGLGAKDFSAAGNRIDPLNNGVASLQNVAVKGLYMPDGMATYESGGRTLVVMANEGDFREDDADRSVAGTGLGVTGLLANLRVSNTDSTATDLYVAGARSFSIRDTDGNLIYDSGEILDREAIAAGIYDDGRSRDKGVEPEGVELMQIGGRTYAFVGLERTLQAAIAMFDITDAENTQFMRLIVSPGDRAPEGLKGYQLDGQNYLAFSNEGSNTTTVIALVPEPGSLALAGLGLALGALLLHGRRLKR